MKTLARWWWVLCLLLAPVLFAQLREKRVSPIDPQENRRFDTNRRLGVAVLVGVGQYPAFGGLGGLRYATRDVDALARELANQRYSVVQLKDSEAVGRAILNAINQAGELLDPEQGTLIFFFSGHGFAESGVNYLASFDAAANDLTHTGVPVNAIEQAMARTGAKRRIMWIDACRNEPGKGTAEGRTFTRFADSTGTRILFSTKAGRISYEDDQLQEGLFTYFLVKGLQGGAGKDDGLISFRDLADFVVDQVGNRSLQQGHVQVPYEAGESSGDFLIARSVLPAQTIAQPTYSPPRQDPIRPQLQLQLPPGSQPHIDDNRARSGGTTTFEGNVTGLSGEAINGALIQLYRRDKQGHYQVKSDRKGHWLYTGLPLGIYDITCTVAGQLVDSVIAVPSEYGDYTEVNFDSRKSRQTP